ncbi:MAG: DUF3332 domain-containing protein [Tannerellaceae bacterium]|jgi:hypothetical protein|nr:DUF3332 domain-containing protein [Tannerellaceae bacterium]
MKKKNIALVLAVSVSAGILLSSCIGSFPVFHKIKEWNNSIGDKWANEVVFLALWIIPVYEVTFFLDITILNSIEFWTGENPLADFATKTIKGKDGMYTVEKKTNGYIIRKEGDNRTAEFIFGKEDNSWSLKTDGYNRKLLKYTAPRHAVVYLPDGREMNVELNPTGVLAFRQAIQSSFFAIR